MKLKFRAEPKDVIIFFIFAIFLLYLVAIAVLNLHTFSTEGIFWGINPFPAFGKEFLFTTLVFYILALVGIMLSVSSLFFEREKGFGFIGTPKAESGYQRWMTDKEMKNAKDIKRVKIVDDEYDAAGVPIINDGKYAWVDDGENHTLIIGATGCGKTQCVMYPLVKILAKKGESMIITDPKGELYQETANMMKEKGYKVILLNFREPQAGDAWNPFSYPYRLYKEGNVDKAKELVSDLGINILTDVANKPNDTFWQDSASNYFIGLTLGLFQDATEDQVNLNSINLMDTLGDERIENSNTTYLKEYFHSKSETDTGRIAASGVIEAPDVTKGGVTTTFKTKVRVFSSNDTLSEMLSYSDFDLRDIGKEKTAVFLRVHEEKTTYHALATIFIKQCYESLIEVAQQNEDFKLKYKTNFVLDEFANFPALKDVESMVSAARSRNIRFNFVIQNFSQLNQTYGPDIAETIKSNCGNIYFMITTELKALEEISRLCGDVRPPKVKEGMPQEPIRPLVTIIDLQQIKQFQVLIKRFRCAPFKTQETPNFQMDWGKDYGKAEFPKREIKEVQVFNVKDYVINKIKEEGLDPTSISGRRPMMNPFVNPFTQRGPQSMPVQRGNAGITDMDEFVKRLDEKIAELEAEEEAEKKKTEKQEKPKEIKEVKPKETIQEEIKPVEEKKEIKTEPKIEKEKQEEPKEEIEKPKINVDVDSIIVDENITDDDFFDDFFGEDE